MKRRNDSPSSSKKRVKFLDNDHKLGTIQSVCLRNFMCHENLKFDFDPNVNFVVGQNGSGKSAVLTGIILALGGRSATTGRFTNLKGYIKTGKQKASISVVLNNRGHFAYKTDLFGEKIIVEREIFSNGSSDYKLKSQTGKIISTQKDELNSILTAMDIQIANPILILTQENSRNFLLSKQGSDTKLYEFFYKGTGLYTMEDNYRQASSTREEAEKELSKKKEVLTNQQKELERWKKFTEASKKVGELRKELLWAGVSEMEEKVEENKRLKEEVQKNLSNFKHEKEECESAYAKVCSILKQSLKRKSLHISNVTGRKAEMSNLNAQRDNFAENMRQCQGTLDLYKREEEKLLKDISCLEISMKENQIQNQKAIESKKKENDEEIQRLEEENFDTNSRQQNIFEESERLYKRQESARLEINCLHDRRAHNEIIIQSLLNDKIELQNAIKNRQYLFGKNTPSVLDEIHQRSHQFIKLPKGPIGLDVEVIDSKWEAAVEVRLGRDLLCSYCCDNVKDSIVLKEILTKYYDNNDVPSIIISEYLSEVHDMSRQKVNSNYPTLFDMIKIKDATIANCLIDQANIETVLLVPDIDAEDDIMWTSSSTNCSSILYPNCVEILENPRRCYYAKMERNTNHLLRPVNTNYIRLLEEEITKCNEETENVKKRIKELEIELQGYSEKIEKIEGELMQHAEIYSQNTSMINELKQYDDMGNQSEMHEDLDTLKEDLERKRGEINKNEIKLSIYESKLRETDGKLQELKELLQKEASLFDEMESEISLSQEKKNNLESDKKRLELSVINAEKELNFYKTAIRKDEKTTQKAINTASEGCPRIDTSRSSEEIRIELNATEKVLEEESNCSRIAMPKTCEEKLQNLIQAHTDLKSIQSYCKKLESMLKKREKKMKEIIKHFQCCLDLEFVVFLKSNGFNGRLNFSKPQSLSLEATPKQDLVDDREQKSCTSLSGGERSFVTLCFILSLWSRTRMPFLIMDEYDVFMDPHNRNSSIKLLLQAADSFQNAQFIFLSPLELPELPESATNIKVHRMPAPERIKPIETPTENELL